MADEEAVPSTAVNLASRMDDETSDDKPAPRENMISNAVRFLQNPKVRESPFAQRKAFLAKKGLTSEEIEIAVTRSGTAGDATQAPPAVTAANHSVLPVTQVAPPVPVSPWSRWRDRTATAIVVGGISYGIYQLVKKYVLPLWLGPSEEERRTQALQTSIKELESSLQAVVSSLGDIQRSFKDQQEQLRQVVLNTAANRGPVEYDRMQQQQNVAEIKGEIQSLKGLLLSRKQFPPTPKTNPVIPAWQLGSSSPENDASSVNRPPATTGSGTSSPTLSAKGTSTADTGPTPAQEAALPTPAMLVNGTGEDKEVEHILKEEEKLGSDVGLVGTLPNGDINQDGGAPSDDVAVAAVQPDTS